MKKKEGGISMSDIVFKAEIRRNFFVLAVCWSCYMYCYYIFHSYLVYTLGSTFIDTLTTANVESFSYLLAGAFLYPRFGGKPIISLSLLASGFLSAFLILFTDTLVILGAIILAVRALLSMTLMACFLTSFDSFPT